MTDLRDRLKHQLVCPHAVEEVGDSPYLVCVSCLDEWNAKLVTLTAQRDQAFTARDKFMEGIEKMRLERSAQDRRYAKLQDQLISITAQRDALAEALEAILTAEFGKLDPANIAPGTYWAKAAATLAAVKQAER